MQCRICQTIIEDNPAHVFVKGTKEYLHRKCGTCSKCNGNLKGLLVTVGENIFHDKCFKCDCGGKAIKNFKYSALYCRSCAPCYFCGKKENLISTRRFNYHEECFKCSKCNLRIHDSVYYRKDNNFFHQNTDCNKQCIICLDKLGDDPGQDFLSFPIHSVHENNEIMCRCGESIYHIDKIPTQWNKRNHHLFSSEIKSAIQTILLARKRKGTLFSMLPKDMIFYLAAWIATPLGWKTFNGYNIDDVCTISRCKYDTSCGICYAKMSPFPSINNCSVERCVNYKYRCENCGLIPLGSDESETCTPYRCVTEMCEKCEGELHYNENDNEDLCYKNWCKTYSDFKCSCGTYIRQIYIDPFKECTTYRCINQKCKECGNEIGPFEDTEDFCIKDRCFTKVLEKRNLYKYITGNLPLNFKLLLTNKQIYRQMNLALSEYMLKYDDKTFLLQQSIEKWYKLSNL